MDAHRQILTVQTVKFPQQPFDAVARHGLAHFTGYGHARARAALGMLSRQHENEEMFRMEASAPLITGSVLRPTTDAQLAGQGVGAHGCVWPGGPAHPVSLRR